jgi:hypothetical protein
MHDRTATIGFLTRRFSDRTAILRFAFPHRRAILGPMLTISALTASEPLVLKYIFDTLGGTRETSRLIALVLRCTSSRSAATADWLTWRTRIGLQCALLEAAEYIAAKETSIACCFSLEFGMFKRRIYRWFSPGGFLERHIRPDINLHELMAADVELYCELLTKELGSPFKVDYRRGSVGSDLYCLTLYL